MLSHRVQRIGSTIIIGLSLLASGCYSQVSIPIDSLVDSNEEDIVVTTMDSRRVTLSGHDYWVMTNESGERFLRGTGRIQTRPWSQDEPFDGVILLSEIETIYVAERSILFYASVAGILASVTYLLWSWGLLAPVF